MRRATFRAVMVAAAVAVTAATGAAQADTTDFTPIKTCSAPATTASIVLSRAKCFLQRRAFARSMSY